jgi:hypothetical protein
LRAILQALALAMLSVETIGCGGQTGPELVPVAGRVMMDGRPAAEGMVTFRHSTSGTFEASGLIEPDGTYKLVQKDQEGAQVGDYRVVVFVRKTPRSPTGEMAGLPAIVVNKKFTDVKTTPLIVTVKKDAPSGTYDLTVTH